MEQMEWTKMSSAEYRHNMRMSALGLSSEFQI